MSNVTFKTLAEAVKHVGGEANALAILSAKIKLDEQSKVRRKRDAQYLAAAKAAVAAGTLKLA